MKNSMHLFFLLVLVGALSTSCKKNNNNDDTIPDTTFEIEVSGSETNSFNITIPSGEPHTDFTIIGSHSSVANMMALSFRELPTGWGLTVNVTANSVSKGTFQSIEAQGTVSSYSNNTAANPFIYLSTDNFQVTITNSKEFANAAGITIYIVDGTFSGTMEAPDDPSETVTVNGSFSGVSLTTQ